MADKEKPAGKDSAAEDTAKATKAHANGERDRCAAIAKLCNEAGMSALTDGLIAAGASVEDVTAKIEAAGEIKTICAQAAKFIPGAQALAADFIARGVSPEAARKALWDRMADASEATAIVNTLTPEAAAALAGGAQTLDTNAIWAARNGRK